MNLSTRAATDDMALELLGRGETIQFIARGRSMWPFVKDGDHVVVGPLDRMPVIGEVVFCPNEDFGQLHRVIDGPRDGQVCLRGDALPKADGWVPAENILGLLLEQSRLGHSVPLRQGIGVVRIAQSLASCRRGIHLLRSFFGFR